MKKIFICIFIFLFVIKVNAKEIEVKFIDCVDGDTAKFIYNDEIITARFLAIDTPETVHPKKGTEKLGKEASDFTCKKIKNAKEIVLEFDENSDEKDKYGRYLVWIFLDNNLLQKELVETGLAEIAYIYADYKYLNILEKSKKKAKENNLGMWEESKPKKEYKDAKNNEIVNYLNSIFEKYKEYIILIGALIIVSIFNLKSKLKIKTKLKNKIKRDIKKRLK